MKDKLFISEIVSILCKTLKPEGKMIPLHAPLFQGKEWEYLKRCLDTGWVSSAGEYVNEFESRLEQYTGVKYAVAVVNGTAALHLCLLLAGVNRGDEVLVPALTFVATANAVSYCSAIPHLIDSSCENLCIDPVKLDRYLNEISQIRDGICINKNSMRRIRAVIAMHTFGQPADLDPLCEVCKKYKLELIEDAAEAMGTLYKGRHVGAYGKSAALSFNGNKIITTGGGGAFLTNDPERAEAARHLSTTAKLPHRWAFIHDRTGYNYRMPNLNAALGCAQIERMDDFVRNKRDLAEKYRIAFQNVPGAFVFQEKEYSFSNYWLNVLILDSEYAYLRDEIIAESNAKGICTRPAWTLMNQLPMYRDSPHMDLTGAEILEQRVINLPSSADLGKERDWDA